MKKMKKKLLVIFLLIISYIILNIFCGNEVFAISQTIITDIDSIDSTQYPQIKEMLQQLKIEHPNWNFKILYTDLEWKEVIANEYVGHGSSPRNLVPANNSRYDDAWKCRACKENIYDSGNWCCASEAAIEYMMDPRNSANYTDIFQFMELTYTESNIDTIKTMVNGTFLNNESYMNAIIDSAKKYNVNSYYIIARILQEQGKDGSVLSSGAGYNGQYVGYYNIFNIGASGNGKEAVILNGLKKAKSKDWTTLEKSIEGGVEIIAQSYIAKGQNTLHFQKFDVENSDDNLYWHQYMQNILAAQSEGETLRKTFESVNTVDGGYTFIIPLYKNMPETAAPRPVYTTDQTPITSDLVKVNVTSSLFLRDEAKKDANKIGSVYKDEIITRLEKATEKVDGTYWDYVMKADGTKGYAARETFESETTYKLYLVPIEQEKPTEPENPEDQTPTEPSEPEDSGTTTVIKNDILKIDTESNDVTTVPGATVKDFADLIGKEVTIKNAKGEVLSADSKLATGCIIDDTYTVAVLGDVNGDGEVDTGDTFLLKLVILGQRTLEGECFQVSSDINNDGSIDTGDAFVLKKQVLKISNITL